MKTITEYRPLIFTRILGSTADRPSFRLASWGSVAVVALYCAAGLWLSIDTGFAPWTWQFWTAFGPLFIAGEIAVHEIVAMAGPRPDSETP